MRKTRLPQLTSPVALTEIPNAMSNWKQTNVTAETLFSLLLGSVAIVFIVAGLQSWVDSRINARVVPVERQLDALREELKTPLCECD